MNNEQQIVPSKKQITAPYVSVATLEKLVDFISTHNYSLYSSEIFKKQGFNDSDASWSVNTLKFLGLLNDDGTCTPLMAKLRLLGDARKTEIEKIVKAAYKSLFDVMAEPQNLSPDKLVNEFVVVYDMSRRLAESAARVFGRLCEYGGIKEESVSVPRTPRAPRPRLEKVVKTTDKKAREIGFVAKDFPVGSHIQPIIKGKMSITIPEEVFLRSATDDALNDAWRTVLKEAHSFAEKYLKDETVNPSKTETDSA